MVGEVWFWRLKMSSAFQIGDLVRFDASHALGVVVALRKTGLTYDNVIYDVLVHWVDGEVFWCMDFTLEHL